MKYEVERRAQQLQVRLEPQAFIPALRNVRTQLSDAACRRKWYAHVGNDVTPTHHMYMTEYLADLLAFLFVLSIMTDSTLLNRSLAEGCTLRSVTMTSVGSDIRICPLAGCLS